MYFTDAVKVLVRRWYVVVVGIALIAGASFAATQVVPATYQASGQVLLLLPATATGKATPSNPYLNLQSGLTLVASLIASNLTTPDAQRDMVTSGFRSAYTASVEPGTGPLLAVTTEGNDPQSVLATRNEVLRRVNQELATIQAGENVPALQVIGARSFGVTAQAEVLGGSKIRAIGVILAMGIVLTAMAAFVLDRWLPRRRGRDVRAPDGPGRHEAMRSRRDAADRAVLTEAGVTALDGEWESAGAGHQRS